MRNRMKLVPKSCSLQKDWKINGCRGVWNKGTRKLYWDMDNKKNSSRCTCYIRV
nr:MAG TPA: hypothetical protein [Caudoviricetes sp.]